jgi:hypothetical protein
MPEVPKNARKMEPCSTVSDVRSCEISGSDGGKYEHIYVS